MFVVNAGRDILQPVAKNTSTGAYDGIQVIHLLAIQLT